MKPHSHCVWNFCVLFCGVVLLLTGCGGSSKKSAGPTFKQQFDEAEKIADAEARARRLLQLALDQHKGQDASGAKQTLAAAVRACGAVKAPAPRVAIYSELAGVQASLGNQLEADQALKSAVEATEGIKSAEERARALCQIATIQGGKLKNKNDASNSLDAAEEQIPQIEDQLGRTLIQVEIIKACAAADLKKQGERVLTAGLADAQAQTDAGVRADAFTHFAMAQMAINQKSAAIETLNLAVESTTQIERVYKRIYALTDVANAFVKAGDKGKAKKLLLEAETLVVKVPEADLQAEALERVQTALGKL